MVDLPADDIEGKLEGLILRSPFSPAGLYTTRRGKKGEGEEDWTSLLEILKSEHVPGWGEKIFPEKGELLLVRLTADNPLICPDVVEWMVRVALTDATPHDIGICSRSDRLPHVADSFPPGQDVECFFASRLLDVGGRLSNAYVAGMGCPVAGELSCRDYDTSIDTPADLERVRSFLSWSIKAGMTEPFLFSQQVEMWREWRAMHLG